MSINKHLSISKGLMAVALGLILSLPLAALPLLVPMDDEVVVFLDKMASRGVLQRWLNDSGPLTRHDVAVGLKELDKAKDALSVREIQLLNYFSLQYYAELDGRKHSLLSETVRESWWPLAGRKEMGEAFQQVLSFDEGADPAFFILHESEDRTFRLHWSESLRSENRDSEHPYLWRDHFELDLSLGRPMGVYLDATRMIQTYNQNYPELSDAYRGGFLMKLDEGVEYYSYDYSHSYVNFQGKYGNLIYSNYPIHWGNSSQSLFLDDAALAYPALQWNTRFGNGKYSFLHGWLLPYESERDSIYNNKDYVSKYVVGHRWEFSPWSWMNAAFSEFVVYGDRPVEPTYLLPMIFLWSAQHNLNDRGNMLLGVEGEIFPVKGLKLYGSFFLDELVVSELLNDWWANKQGYQLGMHLAGRTMPWSADLRTEISYVRPWTYTHKYDYNIFTHNGSGLGFPYGPNSLFFTMESRMYPSLRLRLDLSYTQLLKGENPLSPGDVNYYPIGDDPNQNYNLRNPAFDQATTWIMGDEILTRKLTLRALYRLTQVLQLHSEIALEKTDAGNYLPYYHFRLAMNY